ncbi:MAG: PfkB family carbohydrate kinase [Sediminibacterium sp.]
MYDICCIGHITLDKVVTPQKVVHMAGGTSFYFSNAIRNMDVKYHLVTALSTKEMSSVIALREKNIGITVLPSKHTVYFENIYPENQDHRIQKVSQKADPFTVDRLSDIDAKIFHLGPLLADDMPVSLIKLLAGKGKVSLDVQGYLREVRGEDVFPLDWTEKKEALPYTDILKANETEMEKLTGQTDIEAGAKILASWGVKEVVITLGSKGSVIYFEDTFYKIPAYKAIEVVDATGCGDTYMAGYLCQRIKGASVQQAGEFAAAMATIKIQSSGPFTGKEEDVVRMISSDTKKVFAVQ